MTVYIVMCGENGEGGVVKGVFADEDAARVFAEGAVRKPLGPWARHPTSIMAWEDNRVDYWEVEKWEVSR